MPLPAYSSTYQIHCSTCTHYIDRQTAEPRHLNCCGRIVCGDCIIKNPRFGIYCPFCQSPCTKNESCEGVQRETPSSSSFRPLPPPYTPPTPAPPLPPPSYSTTTTGSVTHYLRETDTLQTLSLQYNLPLPLLRSHNRIFADNLLHGRRCIGIPSPPYIGPSLSPEPGDIVAEGRKAAAKRFQLRTKCLDADVAEVYLSAADWDEELAVGNWVVDEKWLEENPMVERRVGKGKGREVVLAGRGGQWGLRGFGY
ncbi:hypothetical protein L873DRAFT_30579 [Choiromyces venosus 120613-1]|uniref:RING-type domain-containing protein n=1 Tax=Choiromyces venosus 120613-1 TaxID=1336337 RepID=A0A3N4KK64_9PEZI|nr:hypothetical protein L873DRAFT_30579 [Choiromyces venosus 120613-1]